MKCFYFIIKLETFTNQLHPAKDRVHEILESSTYSVEENSPRITKKKAAELLWKTEEGSTDVAKEHKHAKSEKKKKKKTGGADKRNPSELPMEDLVQQLNLEGQQVIPSGIMVDTTAGDQPSPTDFENEEQLFEAYRLHVSQEETNEIKEKIKKKLRDHLFSSDDQQHLLQTSTDNKKRRKKRDLVEIVPETRYLVFFFFVVVK